MRASSQFRAPRLFVSIVAVMFMQSLELSLHPPLLPFPTHPSTGKPLHRGLEISSRHGEEDAAWRAKPLTLPKPMGGEITRGKGVEGGGAIVSASASVHLSAGIWKASAQIWVYLDVWASQTRMKVPLTAARRNLWTLQTERVKKKRGTLSRRDCARGILRF